MIVLLAWIGAVVISGLILGIVGFGLFGAFRRTQRAAAALRTDVVVPGQALVAGINPEPRT